MFGMGMQELIIIGIIALLLFGKRLPEVAKSLGKSYRDFRRGLADIQSSIDLSDVYDSRPTNYAKRRSYEDYDDYDEPTAPRFEPPPSEPQIQSSEETA